MKRLVQPMSPACIPAPRCPEANYTAFRRKPPAVRRRWARSITWCREIICFGGTGDVGFALDLTAETPALLETPLENQPSKHIPFDRSGL